MLSLKIHAPFITKSIREIVENGIQNGVDFSQAHTYYHSENRALDVVLAVPVRNVFKLLPA